MSEWPTVTHPRVWHVGTLSVEDKGRGSNEGSGLSVSHYPSEWRRIARGKVFGDTWLGQRQGACFLNSHELTNVQRDIVMAWGIAEGYAVHAYIWRHTYFDDELDSEVYCDYPDEAAARYEAESSADLDGDEEPTLDALGITRIPGYETTQKLVDEALQDKVSHGTKAVLDLLLPLYADLVLGYDGVWWEDDLDPASYSAPRGVIARRRVQDWTWEVQA